MGQRFIASVIISFALYYREVIRLGNQLLEKESANPQLYYYLGVARRNQKQFPQACRAFEISDSLLPGQRPVILDLAGCYMKRD